MDAIKYPIDALAKAPPVLNGPTLDLLRIDATFHNGFQARRLIGFGNSVRDLLAGEITCTVESIEFMLGTK
ncbi:hypothetical protein SH139x_004802 [Planctomycetaceae bacterium SH139]|jgi:hypothetical protein